MITSLISNYKNIILGLLVTIIISVSFYLGYSFSKNKYLLKITEYEKDLEVSHRNQINNDIEDLKVRLEATLSQNAAKDASLKSLRDKLTSVENIKIQLQGLRSNEIPVKNITCDSIDDYYYKLYLVNFNEQPKQ